MKILKNTHLQYKETAFSTFLWDKKPLSFRHKIYHERRIFLRNKNNFIYEPTDKRRTIRRNQEKFTAHSFLRLTWRLIWR